MIDVETMITQLIEREGREYSDRAADRGGPTKFGVTLKTLSAWRKRDCTADDVRNLQEPEARDIYRSRYLVEPGLYKIRDPYVLVLAFDCGVNHGTDRAVRWLQQIVGVVDDGKLGPQTEVAIASYEPVRLYRKLLAKRVRFFGQIIARDPERVRASQNGFRLQAENAGGWLNRAAEFIEEQVT